MPANKPTVFISYSHLDSKHLEYVRSHLASIAEFEIWDDSRIKGGDEWRQAIERALGNSDIFVLLVSRHFLTSEFIRNTEVKQMLEHASRGGVRIFPILLSSCAMKGYDWLTRLNLRPGTEKALLDYKPLAARNKVMAAIANEIAEILENEATSPVREIAQPLAHDAVDGHPTAPASERSIYSERHQAVRPLASPVPGAVASTAFQQRVADALPGGRPPSRAIDNIVQQRHPVAAAPGSQVMHVKKEQLDTLKKLEKELDANIRDYIRMHEVGVKFHQAETYMKVALGDVTLLSGPYGDAVKDRVTEAHAAVCAWVENVGDVNRGEVAGLRGIAEELLGATTAAIESDGKDAVRALEGADRLFKNAVQALEKISEQAKSEAEEGLKRIEKTVTRMFERFEVAQETLKASPWAMQGES